MEIEEKTLWDEFKYGDNEALSHLYKSYVHELFSYGMRIHGDNQLVKDCIQEVFIHLIEKKRTLLITEFSSAYLFKCLRNKLLEEVRTKNNRTDILRLITSDENNQDENIEQFTVKTEEELSRQRVIDAALGSLSNYQREAIFLKYSQGFNYDKIAEILGIDIASARTLIYRSLKKIKESVFNKIFILFSFQFIRLK
jgi:RNA polymerase sigma factor (sigma-70 family)